MKTMRTLDLLIFMSLVLVGSRASDPLSSCQGTNEGNATYNANVGTLLSTLAPQMNPYGFYNSSLGSNPNKDKIYVLGLCRADASMDQCRRCIRDVATQLPPKYPNCRRAYLWLEYCMIQYSSQYLNMLRSKDIPRDIIWKNTSELNPYFREDVRHLLRDLSVQAASGSSMKASVGNRNTTEIKGGTTVYGGASIYAMLQCNPMLSSEDCQECLGAIIDQISFVQVSMIQEAVSWVKFDCMIRYDLHKFYNETRLMEVGVLPPSPSQPLPSHTGKNRKTNIIVIISAAIGGCVCLIGAGVGAFIFIRLRSQECIDEEMGIPECVQYDFARIRNATNDFSDANKLGQGGFGAVYKGILPQNGQEIAVKRLLSGNPEAEFKNEVKVAAALQHRNLVKIFGFCIEATERLIVFEFVQNGSLDKILFDPTRSPSLDWDMRHKIISGIARGLLYLHEDSLTSENRSSRYQAQQHTLGCRYESEDFRFRLGEIILAGRNSRKYGQDCWDSAIYVS